MSDEKKNPLPEQVAVLSTKIDGIRDEVSSLRKLMEMVVRNDERLDSHSASIQKIDGRVEEIKKRVDSIEHDMPMLRATFARGDRIVWGLLLMGVATFANFLFEFFRR